MINSISFVRKPGYRYRVSTITLTWGDQAENHVGMEKIGNMAENGFNVEELKNISIILDNYGIKSEYFDLNNLLGGKGEEAGVLIIRNGFDKIMATHGYEYNSGTLYDELRELECDAKALMYGQVRNKKARYNLCFADYNQEPDYENGMGRILSFESIPALNVMRELLPEWFGAKASELQCEGNYYYDAKSCYIGAHGDSERRRVIGMRFGHDMNLCYQWYKNSVSISDKKEFMIHHGDIYIMSEKAVGTDWKRKTIPTLRHNVDPYTYKF